MHSPFALVLAVGALLGSMLALSKIAIGAGVPALAYAFWQALGGGAILLALAALTRQLPRLAPAHLRYYLIAGLLTTAVPNTLLFLVVPHLGASLAGTVFALPPLVTAALLALAGKQRLSTLCLAGLVVGLAGTLLALWGSPGAALAGRDISGWMALALAIPVVLALGNIYRSLAWPPGAPGLALAAGMLLAAAAMLLPAMLASGSGYWPLALRSAADAILVAQSAITAAAFVLYFRLQRLAGPVYLSQIGYVMMLTGIVGGTLFLGERLGGVLWLAFGLILAGVAIVNGARSRLSAALPQ